MVMAIEQGFLALPRQACHIKRQRLAPIHPNTQQGQRGLAALRCACRPGIGGCIHIAIRGEQGRDGLAQLRAAGLKGLAVGVAEMLDGNAKALL